MRERARSLEDKQQRAEALLDAAEALSLELGGVRFVSVAAVTERAGLHRTGVRRYFANREELFLELAARCWSRWHDSIQALCTGKANMTPAEVATVIRTTIVSMPVFCDLLTHVPLTLEGDVELEAARRYKTVAYAQHDGIVSALHAASVMSTRQVESLLAATILLAAGFWQLSHPTPTLAKLYAEVPHWGHAVLDFERNLDHLLTAMAIGLVHQPD